MRTTTTPEGGAASSDIGPQEAAPPRVMMPPYLVLRDFLDDATAAGLLEHALSGESDFQPTKVGSKALNPSIRFSTGTRNLGPYRQILKAKILDLTPSLISQLQVNAFEASGLETELVAHSDGAFYKRHLDTQTTADLAHIRVLSGVYYLHGQPKAFTGGALRLHAIFGESGKDFVDIEPAHNSLLVFPSWAPHEVMPVSCPSMRFADSRFAVNCWVYR